MTKYGIPYRRIRYFQATGKTLNLHSGWNPSRSTVIYLGTRTGQSIGQLVIQASGVPGVDMARVLAAMTPDSKPESWHR